MEKETVKKIRKLGDYIFAISVCIGLPIGVVGSIILILCNFIFFEPPIEYTILFGSLMYFSFIFLWVGVGLSNYCPNKRTVTYCDYD